ncbi:hypothetical protein MRB53_005641 [Persea americana]|uniref:Uncharacterized protein n=1 Tax=Persea americana TaxID=3435 RepID=A0ACC2MEF4_PERAE|nr:hypothetical protein MRB53_005641 [Persea americana]
MATTKPTQPLSFLLPNNPTNPKPSSSLKQSSIISLPKLCNSMKEVQQIHTTLIKTGLIHDPSAMNAIIEFSITQDLPYAQSVFQQTTNPTTFAKNLMLRGLSQSQFPLSAFSLYVEFTIGGFQLNKFAFTALIQACSRSKAVREGEQIHAQILKCGEMDAHLASSTIQFYVGVCGGFGIVPEHAEEGFRPDERTLASVLPSVSRLGALSLGKWVHSYAENLGMEMNVFLGSALVDMYSKCGSIDSAIGVFNRIGPLKRNVVLWNAMIGGFAMHGHGRDALQLFQTMLASGIQPTDVTFVGVLRACSHAGMVDQGLSYFKAMTEGYNVEPTIEHYGCMVDLLGRAGRLEEAEKLMKSTDEGRDVVLLKTLLGACRVHGNIEIGERIGNQLIDLASDDSSCYVLLANLFASVGRWEDVNKLRNLMKKRGVRKIAGCTSIELDSVVHEFHAGDMSHPRIEEIYAKLEEIRLELKVEGYIPNTSQVLADTGEEEKEASMYRHSEKLAIAFGLINTTPGSTIRIVKNLRVCLDCHTVTKLISKLYDREIIVRDQNRFHHFKNGLCSCSDYW